MDIIEYEKAVAWAQSTYYQPTMWESACDLDARIRGEGEGQTSSDEEDEAPKRVFLPPEPKPAPGRRYGRREDRKRSPTPELQLASDGDFAMDDDPPAPPIEEPAPAQAPKLPSPPPPPPLRSSPPPAPVPEASSAVAEPRPKSPRKLHPVPPPLKLPQEMIAPVVLSRKRRKLDEEDAAPGPAKKVKKGEGSKGKKSLEMDTGDSKAASTSTTTTTTTTASTKSKGKGKQLVKDCAKQLVKDYTNPGYKKVAAEHKTISSYLAYLHSETDLQFRTSGPLYGCRVILCNMAANANSPINEIDKALISALPPLIRLGATVQAPDHFVPSSDDYRNVPIWNTTAQDEGWTTHIIPLETGRTKRFSHILATINDGTVTSAELGPVVKVVEFAWISACIRTFARADEQPHLIAGDPRARPPPRALAAQRPKKIVAPKKGRQRVTPDSDEDGEDAGDVALPCSPLNINDFPPYHDVPNGYFDAEFPNAYHGPNGVSEDEAPPSSPLAHQTTASDPIVDADVTMLAGSSRSSSAWDGLEEQFKHIEQLKELYDGDKAQVLEVLDQTEKDQEDTSIDEDMKCMEKWWEPNLEQDLIRSERLDDNQTEEEDNAGIDEEERNKDQKRKSQKAGYMCDDPSRKTETGPNEFIAKNLELISKMQERGSFRERGYAQGAKRVRSCTDRITTYSQAVGLGKGIGKSIASKIFEIVQTGTHRRLTWQSDKNKVIKMFEGIYGIGPNIAEDYYNLYGCRTINDIVNCTAKPLTESQKLGVEFYDDLAKRIPREEVKRIHTLAEKAAALIDPKLEVYAMGSYRRGQPDCGDIDFLVTRDPADGKNHRGMIKKLYTALVKSGVIRNSLTQPEDWNALDFKWNGLAALPEKGALMRRMDILGVPFDELPAALIYFTGNDYFNRSMRLKARHMGFRLNQRGLYGEVMRGPGGVKLTQGVKLDLPTEKAIFERLKVTWRPPEERMP